MSTRLVVVLLQPRVIPSQNPKHSIPRGLASAYRSLSFRGERFGLLATGNPGTQAAQLPNRSVEDADLYDMAAFDPRSVYNSMLGRWLPRVALAVWLRSGFKSELRTFAPCVHHGDNGVRSLRRFNKCGSQSLVRKDQ